MKNVFSFVENDKERKAEIRFSFKIFELLYLKNPKFCQAWLAAKIAAGEAAQKILQTAGAAEPIGASS